MTWLGERQPDLCRYAAYMHIFLRVLRTLAIKSFFLDKGSAELVASIHPPTETPFLLVYQTLRKQLYTSIELIEEAG